MQLSCNKNNKSARVENNMQAIVNRVESLYFNSTSCFYFFSERREETKTGRT